MYLKSFTFSPGAVVVMVVGFTTTYAISACCEFEFHSVSVIPKVCRTCGNVQ